MAILNMQKGAAFGFLLSEATLWRSREKVAVKAGATGPMLAGTLLAAGATADDPLVAWSGTGETAGILCQTVGANQTEFRTIVDGEAEVVGADLVLPEGVELEAATEALKALQVKVRVNEGLKISTVFKPGPDRP